MALTLSGGPLSRGLADARNFTVTGPAHSLLLEPFRRRVRAEVDGVVVLDTVGGALLHETGLLPQLYVPEADLAAGLLEPSTTSTHCPFKGDATYRSLRVHDRVVPDAVWSYPDPTDAAMWLRGLAALPMTAADRWLDEDEEVLGHLTDPYHRVDVRPSSRPVRVVAGDGTVIADAAGSLLLDETGFELRPYLDPDAVSGAVTLERTDTTTVCPYKGVATWWSVRIADRVLPDAAWSYEAPRAEAHGVAGRVCFDHAELTTTLGG